jgi:hypothetical protein
MFSAAAENLSSPKPTQAKHSKGNRVGTLYPPDSLNWNQREIDRAGSELSSLFRGFCLQLHTVEDFTEPIAVSL